MTHFNRWCFILLLAVPACLADSTSVTFTNLPWNYASGEYVGWSIATVGGSQGAVNQLLMCDDFYDEQPMPAGPFQADPSILSKDLSATDINNTEVWSFQSNVPLLFYTGASNLGGNGNAAENYAAAGWLVQEYLTDANAYNSANGSPAPNPTQAAAAANYNFAIWNLFNTAASLPGQQAQDLQSKALAYVSNPANSAYLQGSVLPDTIVYSPTGGSDSIGQEFLQTAPEPATVWLALGGAGLVLLSRKIRRSRA